MIDKVDPADALCEQIERKWKTYLSLEARAQVIGARTAAKMLLHVREHGLRPIAGAGGARLGLTRFFTFALIVHEMATGRKATLTWQQGKSAFSGEFFETAKLFEDTLLAPDFHSRNNNALGKLLARVLRRRTTLPTLPGGRRGRPKRTMSDEIISRKKVPGDY